MRKTGANSDAINREGTRYVDMPNLTRYLTLGRYSARRVAEEAGAVIHIGEKRVVFDLDKIDDYLNQNPEVETVCNH